MATTILISTFAPYPTLTLTLPSDTPISDIPSHLPSYLPSLAEGDLSLSLPSRILTLNSSPINSLLSSNGTKNRPSAEVDEISHRLVSLRLTPRLRGGKGGFGSQLRAAGGRMSSQKTSNNDSCRDLNGRRLSTIKEAKALAAYLESEPERKKAQQEAQKAKLERLERKLGIDGKGKEKEETSSGVKRRFDDTEYIEQSREIVDTVKNAVAAGLLKKKKKTKTSPSPEGEASSSKKAGKEKKPKATESTETKLVEAVLESPATAPIAAVAATSLAAVGA